MNKSIPPLPEHIRFTPKRPGSRHYINQYFMLDTLDIGNFSKVMKCQDTLTSQIYAIKIYSLMYLARQQRKIIRLTSNEDTSTNSSRIRIISQLDYIFEEVSILQQINHDRCIRLHDVVYKEGNDGKLYLAFDFAGLEHCMDGTVHGNCALYVPRVPNPSRMCEMGYIQEIKLEGPKCDVELCVYTEHIAKCIAKDIASALAYLHSPEIRVAHRDLKPDNILLTADGKALLADFGVAARMDEYFHVRGTEGSYHFLSPECCTVRYTEEETNKKKSDYVGHDGRAADVWALGVTIWAMLFGILPFQGTLLELFENLSTTSYYIETNRFKQFVSPECFDLLEKTLCKDMLSRLTAEEVLEHPWIKSAEQSTLLSFTTFALQMKQPEAL